MGSVARACAPPCIDLHDVSCAERAEHLVELFVEENARSWPLLHRILPSALMLSLSGPSGQVTTPSLPRALATLLLPSLAPPHTITPSHLIPQSFAPCSSDPLS
jgi:hypothetical protein